MKSTLMSCSQCLDAPFQFIEFDYFDDGIAKFTCSKGHEITCFVQGINFEKLLESGVHALIHKSTLEACASFYAAYERCLEFSTDVFCYDDGIDFDLLQKAKKSMSRQSERQLGAFLIMHLKKLNKPYILDPKITEFRNSVIHKGYIPNEEEAHEFCKKIYERIAVLISQLKIHCGVSVDVIRQKAIRENAKSLEGMNSVYQMTTQFFHIPATNIEVDFDIALNSYVEGQKSFEEAASSIMRGSP